MKLQHLERADVLANSNQYTAPTDQGKHSIGSTYVNPASAARGAPLGRWRVDPLAGLSKDSISTCSITMITANLYDLR